MRPDCHVCDKKISGVWRTSDNAGPSIILGFRDGVAIERHHHCGPYSEAWSRRFPASWSAVYIATHPKTEEEKQAVRDRFKKLKAAKQEVIS